MLKALFIFVRVYVRTIRVFSQITQRKYAYYPRIFPVYNFGTYRSKNNYTGGFSPLLSVEDLYTCITRAFSEELGFSKARAGSNLGESQLVYNMPVIMYNALLFFFILINDRLSKRMFIFILHN